MTLKFNRVRAIVKVMFMQKLHQRFMSYRGHREKNSDENNTVRRNRADSNNSTLRRTHLIYCIGCVEVCHRRFIGCLRLHLSSETLKRHRTGERSQTVFSWLPFLVSCIDSFEAVHCWFSSLSLQTTAVISVSDY